MTKQTSEEKGEVATMEAPHPKQQATKLQAVEALAAARGLKPWYLAGLRRAAGWAPGKQVGPDEFAQAVEDFNRRRQGGGRIRAGA